MKNLAIVIACLFSLSSFANEKNYKEMEKKIDKMSFEDAQKMKLEMLDKKKDMIDEQKNCVKDAKDKAGLKACSKEMKESKKSMKEKIKDKFKD